MRKPLRAVLLVPVLLVLLFEEWGWQPLARAFSALEHLRGWAQLEQRIARLPPWAALLTFGVPVLALVPVKLLALYLFTQGQLVIGLGVVIAAKLAGTAIAARLFQLTQPALMCLPWFARLYTPWKLWKDRWLDWARSSLLWQWTRRLKTCLRVIARTRWRQIKAAWTAGAP